MKTLLVSSLTALSLMLGGTALAASPAKTTATTMQTCEQLIKKFDETVGGKATAPMIKQAKELRSTGEKACWKGEYAKGVADLKTALNDIGVKTATY